MYNAGMSRGNFLPDDSRSETARLDTLLEGYSDWREEAYRLGRQYDAKGTIGKKVMELTIRGAKAKQLKIGRVLFHNSHLREATIKSYNQELMKTWEK
jgi:hypothetical protein